MEILINLEFDVSKNKRRHYIFFCIKILRLRTEKNSADEEKHIVI